MICTCAFSTGFPAASVTVPEMAPVVTPWAERRVGGTNNASDSIVAAPSIQRGLFITDDPG